MKISIHIILEELKELNPVSVLNFDISFTSYKMLESIPKDNEIINICDVTKFVSMNNITEKKTFVLIDPLGILDEVEISKKVNVIALKENISEKSLVNKMIDIFQKYSEFELALNSYLYKGISLENILVFIYKSLGIEMYLNDSKGNVLFRNSNAYKYYPQTVLISKTIRDGKKALGSLSLMKSKVLSENYQTAVFNIICDTLDSKLNYYFDDKREAYIELNKMLLDNIALNTALDPEQLSKKLSVLDWSIHDDYKLFLINSHRYENIQTIIDYLNEQYKKDSLIFKHDGRYILLINDNKIKSDILISELKLILDSKPDMKILVSTVFSDILEIRKYYLFLEMLSAKINDGIIDLSVDTIKVMLLLTKGFESKVFINSEIKKLKEYDQENDGDLLETLYAYICYERSLVKTAEKLNVHRNTVVYRVNKISEIINIDMENPLLRYHVIISILLIEGEKLLRYN
ncbi:MAG: helix-turn-helix domain-containing protein [Tissierellia bacterium]|nr:helix-turn-helix domain-containing protein [Tissierellia bacterium]